MSDTTKIEPCPNCSGSDMYPQRGIEMHKVVCTTCGYMSGDRPTEAAAIAAHNKVARAVAAAEKLPKTADGVSVVPGMEVWPLHELDDEEGGIIRFGVYDRNTGAFSETAASDGLFPIECYSTREAARAARGESA